MPLKRVTLSGRLAQYEDEKPEIVIPILVKMLAMAFDIGLAFGVAVLSYKVFMGQLAPPYERGFYCYEIEGINHPFQPNTVSSKHVIAVSLGLPFFVIFIAEALFSYSAEGIKGRRKYFFFATSKYLGYMCLFTICVLLIEAAKCIFSRLRPHYLSVCKPDWSYINCTSPTAYITSAHCTGTDEHRIKIGRQSFPSGHSGVAVFFLFYTFMYLKGLVDTTKLRTFVLLRYLVLIPLLSWTAFVLVTRVTDHWHHPTDVLGGIIIGIICASIPFICKCEGYQYVRNRMQNLHHE
uniref:AcidPPc domain-containing protein n=1 Tax=Syphacia muris TaxID=451379 RepID=A0A0N5AM74_9BILA